MGLFDRGAPEQPFENPTWAAWLAGLVPLVVYVFSASGHAYWLDSAEFTAAAVDLDIAHPPGHPVSALWGRAFCLLPVGPMPFRVAVGQAVAAAIGAGALQVALARTLSAFAVDARALRIALSLALTWLLAFSYGYWFQAVRAEVYALQAMLILLALERLIALATDEALYDVRPLYAACFWLGLGLANHHFMSVLSMPALLHGTWRALRKHGPRVIAWCLASGGVGLIGYLYLPLRAQALPPMDLGHPVSWRDFWWVVTARVYARRIGTGATQPMDERFADLALILVEHFSLLSLGLVLIGGYLMLRTRALWPVAYVWGVTALVALCGRAWLNPVRNNPDVLGYMLPGFAGYLVLMLAGVLVPLLAFDSQRVRSRVHGVLAVLGLALAGVQLATSAPSASLRSFAATDAFQAARLRALPSGALVFLTNPESAFLHWQSEAVEHARGDVDVVATPFVNYGASGERLVREHPELAPMLHGFRADGVLSAQPLSALAARRSVLVEADLTASYPLFPWLLPDGLMYRFFPAPPERAAVHAAGRAREALLEELARTLGSELEANETRRQLLWLRFVDALYYASHGELALAVQATRRARALQPEERELRRLEEVLVERPASFRLEDFLPR